MSNVFGTLAEIPLEQIEYDLKTRGRQDYGDMAGLKLSIMRDGLICPIAVYSATGQPPYTLLAGCRRLLVCKELKLNQIACRVYDHELTSYEIKAIELYENIARKDMTDGEKVRMTSQLHQLLINVNGPKIAGLKGGHGIKETAKLLGKSVGAVHLDIKLAKAMDDFPELNLHTVSNKINALRILERLGSAVQNRIIAKQIADKGMDVSDTLISSYIIGDFLENKLTSDSYGFLEVDPPYAINLKEVKYARTTPLHALQADYEEISRDNYPNFIERVCQECFRLANNNSWIIFWYGHEWYELVVRTLSKVGFGVCVVPAIWKKGNIAGQSQSPYFNLGNTYEQFVYGHKGSPRLRSMGRSNIFDFSPVSAMQKIHPTERPKELIEALFQTFVWPGTPVLVPFAGSGNTLVVADKFKHSAIGFDLSQNFKEAFAARVIAKRAQCEPELPSFTK